MAYNTYQPLFSEVFAKLHNAKTKAEKIQILKENDNESLRMIIKSSFDPNIEWLIPDGQVPYRPNEAPEGTEHSLLRIEARKLYNFVKGGNDKLPQFKRENMFIQMLEALHKDEAEVLSSAKDKSLHKKYKGLSANVVKEAFNWNDDFKKV